MNLAILFVDIAGSTELYERVGDARARKITKDCLDRAIATGTKEQGVLVKTIGDEAMVRFATSRAAVRAACNIQRAIIADSSGPKKQYQLAVKIGIHYGPIIQEEGDVFGDVVNVAARMVQLARPRQILVTEELAMEAGGSDCQGVRHIDTALVKGKKDPLAVYEVLWEPEGAVTELVPVCTELAAEEKQYLEVRYRDEERILRPGTRTTFGRAAHCGLVVQAQKASRIHGWLEFRRGKFILADNSTNGTHVYLDDSGRYFLKREEIPLLGKGYFTPGEEGEESSDVAVRFRLR